MSTRRKQKSPAANTPHHPLRIIAGQWRGRKLDFPAIEGLRPTPDRVRETLFNWLAADIAAARCLDLFAGSGALGFEALSRGAAFSCFVDSATAATDQIQASLALLSCDTANCHALTATQWLQQFNPAVDSPFDIIFLDPPFGKKLLTDTVELIHRQDVSTAHGIIYMETGSDEAMVTLPDDWQLHREKIAGQVCYRLFRRQSA